METSGVHSRPDMSILGSVTGMDEAQKVKPDPRSVACPYCKAKPGEHCRTMNGNLTGRQWGFRVDHYRREVAARRQQEQNCDR